MRQEQRAQQIKTLEDMVYKLKLKDKPIERKVLIIIAMDQFNISKRTATEYIDIVFLRLKISS